MASTYSHLLPLIYVTEHSSAFISSGMLFRKQTMLEFISTYWGRTMVHRLILSKTLLADLVKTLYQTNELTDFFALVS